MRAMMVWGLSLCLATAWVRGISPLLACGTWFLSSFAGLEGGGLKCTRGGARGDRPLSGRRCRFTVSLPYCVYCYLPGFGLWGIVAAQYIWTLRRRLYHLTCLSALDLLFGACWTALHVVGVSLFCEAGSAVRGLVTRQLWWPWFACLASAWEAFEFVHYILDGATRGRCLIVLWGRERCQGTGYTAVMVAVGCMPGYGLGGIWMCTLYFWTFVSSMYGHWYWRAVVRGPSFWISRAGESGGVVHVAWSLGSWEAGVASECRLCWCLHTGTWCTWGIDQLSCVYFSLYWDLSSRCIGLRPGMTS